MFLLQIEQISDGFVDALGLLVHAFEILDMCVNRLKHVFEPPLEVLLTLVLFAIYVCDACLHVWQYIALVFQHLRYHVEFVTNVLGLC